MNLSEYQKMARSTAIYLDIDNSRLLYPALGIVGECGEVVEKIKKLLRDDNGEMKPDRAAAIAKELGDCCWYLANICCDTGHDLDMIYDMRNSSTIHQIHELELPQLVLQMSRYATEIAERLETWYYKYRGRPGEGSRFSLPDRMSLIITYIEEVANRCGFTLEDICLANIEKLANRKDRGTLKGEGDNR